MTPPASTEPMYQCSVCTRNKYNGDKSCPLNLDGTNGNSDIFDGINRVIKSCGCGAFIDTRAHVPVAQQARAEPRNELAERECAINNCMRKDWLERHDAALIAQEREKWEREHTPTFHAENPGAFSPWYNVEMVDARVKSAKKQAREDVLDDVMGELSGCNDIEDAKNAIRSLRVKK